jgi:hypothetical protein
MIRKTKNQEICDYASMSEEPGGGGRRAEIAILRQQSPRAESISEVGHVREGVLQK